MKHRHPALACCNTSRPASPWASHCPGSVSIGAGLAILGFLIMLRAWWLFREARTAICPTAPTTQLITHDVYRVTRNPMYFGILLMLLGLAVATAGVFFYVAAVCFFLIIDSVFCPYEEQQLEAVFGETFERYRQHVRRWL
jgi:protein-S-isoprenylcysteine O-methyltransferase Ste14